jgi:hypothetical protein
VDSDLSATNEANQAVGQAAIASYEEIKRRILGTAQRVSKETALAFA